MKKMILSLLGLVILGLGALALLYGKEVEEFSHTFVKRFSQESKEKSAEKEPEAEEKFVKLTEEQIAQYGIQIQKAGPQQLFLTLSTRGKVILDPNRLAHVFPKISGVARETRKNIGDRVRVDEIVAILESQEMADLKANYLAALSKEKLMSSLLEREAKLYQKRISAEQDFLNAQNTYAEAKIALQLARQKLRTFGLNEADINQLTTQEPHLPLRLYNIHSPLEGTIIMRHITKGEFVENISKIYEVADLSLVWVEIGIYPKDLHRIKEGQFVDIVHPLDPTLSSTARLIYVSPLIAEETITAQAIAALDNPRGEWRPGSFVKVNIATEQMTCPLAISKEAIQKMDGHDCVFVLTAQGFEKRVVKIGQCDHNYVAIDSGLEPGERYAASNTFLLKADLNKDTVQDDD